MKFSPKWPMKSWRRRSLAYFLAASWEVGGACWHQSVIGWGRGQEIGSAHNIPRQHGCLLLSTFSRQCILKLIGIEKLDLEL